MKAYAQCVALICLLLVAGCATGPLAQVDTDKKRVAAFEIALQETVRAAISMREQGMLSDEHIAKLDALFTQIQFARFGLHQAIAEQEPEGIDNYLAAAQKILTVINAIIQGAQSDAAKRIDGRPASHVTH